MSVTTFWQALKATYGGSLAVLVAFPLLALVPVAFELVQHVVEVHDGMYDSIAGFRAAGSDSLRLGFGLMKIAALTVPLYWINRFLAYRDPSFARAVSGAACRRFAPFVMVQLALAAISLFVLPQTGSMSVVSLVGGQIVGCLLMAWGVSAPLDQGHVGPVTSASIMWRYLPWTFVFSWVAVLPLMIPHYLFASLAIGARVWLWPILVVDSLLVGCLTVVIGASGFVAATRAAAKKGVSLIPPRMPLPLDSAHRSSLRALR
jgi:predicted small integral membrane protein